MKVEMSLEELSIDKKALLSLVNLVNLSLSYINSYDELDREEKGVITRSQFDKLTTK